MDISSAAWLVDQEMEDPREFINQHQQTLRPYNDTLLMDSLSSQSFKVGYQQDLLVSARNPTYSYINHATINHQDLNKQEIYNNYKPAASATTTLTSTRSANFGPAADICGGAASSNTTFTISFGDPSFNSPTTTTTTNNHQLLYKLADNYHHVDSAKEDLDELLGCIELPKRPPTTRRNHRQAQEHVLAERKRREKLTQRFLSLSALLPEIKKMDKATVLEDASKYIIQLQNRVKELEELTSKSGIPESSTCSRMRRSSKFHHDASSFDEHEEAKSLLCCNTAGAYNPGIKVRISGSNILVRIYCQQMNSSLAVKALTEMERLHFTIVCNSVLQISATAALITIIAQMGDQELVMTAMDLVRCLQSSLSGFV